VSAGRTLAALRAEVRRALDGGDEDALETWSRSLAEDRRAGARALARSCARKLAALEAERRRLEQLFVLRGRLLAGGARYVAGVDEVGVGPLAGPVVAAAVVLPERVDLPGLDDSKKLKPAARERLDAAIRAQAVCWGIGEVEPAEIDRLNILHASLEAMRRAVTALAPAPDHLLVDARRVPGVSTPQTAVVHGDALDGSIAAASIVAKVHRDSLLRRLDERYPGYGLARHKGYPTPDHIAALRRLGPSEIHRRSFAPVAEASALGGRRTRSGAEGTGHPQPPVERGPSGP
jgi:ribonuclease HII